MFKPAKLVKVSCIFPKKHLLTVISKLQDIGVLHLEKSKLIDNFKPIEIISSDYDGLKELLNSADRLIALIESRAIKPLLTRMFGQRRIYIFHKQESEVKEIKKYLKKLSKRYNNLKHEKLNINLRDYSYILYLRNSIKDKLARYSALENFTESNYLVRFAGWVEPENTQRLKRAIEFVTKKACVFTISEPKHFDEVPTLLKNPFFIKPFEIFTEGYGMPEYREIDPTPITALTFTLIFGLMFADLGYGISLTALSLFVYFYTTKESAFRKKLNIVLIYLGLSSMLSGFFLGEFFGVSFRKGVIEPISDIVLFLKISVIAGMIHLSIGLLTKMLSNIKDVRNIIQSASMLVLIWSAFSLFINRGLLSKTLIFASFLVLLAVQKFEALEEVASLVVASLSYMRIAILGFGHIIINRLIVSSYPSMSGSSLGIMIFILLFIMGFAIVLTLGIFVAVIQDLRLHWIEFFPKFFSGRGIAFKALKH